MDYYKIYKNELDSLLEDESNIVYFCDLVKDKIRYGANSYLEIVKFVISFCEQHSLDESKAWMYYYLAWSYSDISDFENAIEVFTKAMDIFEKHDNKKGLAYVCNGLTSFYCQNGQLELSNEIGLRGISFAKEVTDDSILLKILSNISITNIQNKSYEAAKEILEYINTNYNISMLGVMSEVIYIKSMAEIELNLGNPYGALDLIEQALKIVENFDISIFNSEGYKILAMVHAKLKMYEKVEDEFSYSVKVAEEGNNLLEKCETLYEWAVYKFSVGDNENAIIILYDLIKITKDNKFNMILKNSSKLLYNYFKQNNDFENSLKNLELYLQADREINNYKSMRLMAKLNVDHDEKESSLYNLLYDKTEVLFNIGQKIISDLDVNNMALYINSEINKLMKTDYFSIALYNQEKDEVVLRTVVNDELIINDSVKLGNGKTLAEYCIRNKKTVFMNDTRKECKKYIKELTMISDNIKEPLSVISIPLLVNDEIIGVLSVQSLTENTYKSNDVSTLKVLGNYTAIALKNATEYKNMVQIAIYDSLTGFLTKREIVKEGNRIRTEAIEKQKNFCIFMIDIDDFKVVNDTYGHIVGDRVIKMVTQTVGKLVRSTDYIGRYGGDEFLLICPKMFKNTAIKLAEKIRQTVEKTDYEVEDDITINITLSIGIYEFNNCNYSFIDGVSLADAQMYKAKKSNKNKVVTY